jgi:hypothetical protein
MHLQSNLPELDSLAETISSEFFFFLSEASKFELNSSQLMQGYCVLPVLLVVFDFCDYL